jgi:hypothetical protein
MHHLKSEDFRESLVGRAHWATTNLLPLSWRVLNERTVRGRDQPIFTRKSRVPTSENKLEESKLGWQTGISGVSQTSGDGERDRGRDLEVPNPSRDKKLCVC